MAEEDKDIAAVVEALSNMFGSVINTEALITIAESCGGDLNLSVDAVVKITNESRSSPINLEDIPLPSADSTSYQHASPNVSTQSASCSFQQESVTLDPNNVAIQTGSEIPPLTSGPQIMNTPQQPECSQISYSMAMQASSSQAKPKSNSENRSMNSSSPLPSQGATPNFKMGTSVPGNLLWTDQIRRIVEEHNRGSRILILMRGVPGSGKTYLARKLIQMLIGGNESDFKTYILSTDDYFNYNGKYNFNPCNLGDAHAWNRQRVDKAIQQGLSPIIVDNTNVEAWEMEFYARRGVANGYILEVVEPNTPWAYKSNILVKKNIHNVPMHTIKRMLENVQYRITSNWLFRYYELQYPPHLTPPVLRSMPVFHPQEVEANPPTDSDVNNADPIIVNDNPNNAVLAIESDMPTSSISHDDAEEKKTNDVSTDEVQVEQEIQENVEVINSPTRTIKLLEVQKQLEEIEQFEREWENGESWEDGQSGVQTTDKNDKLPKPPRETNPKTETNSDENLESVVKNYQDWSQISMFLSPWNNEPAQSENPIEIRTETLTSSTCMEIGDFDWTKTSHKVVSATPRNINQFHISFETEKIPEKRMFHKSTSTNDESLMPETRRCKNEESHFTAFRKLFKNVSKAALRDIFDQCMGDVNWAVEIVFDGMAANQLDTVDEESDEDEVDDNHDYCTCLSNYNIVPQSSPQLETVAEQEPVTTKPQSPSIVSKKNSKKEIKTSDASLQLKRQIEQNVFIADNHYSEHCLRIRKLRHGEPFVDDDLTNQPSTSQGITNSNQALACVNESNDVSDDEEDSSEGMEELEKTVNINLGREFIAELDALFGRTDMSYPDTLMPKINIPVSLLNEINALWMESLMHQLDEHERQAAKMLQEDEEFARVLAMKEAELALVGKQPEVLDFKEIMDMDYAMSLYQRDVAEWKNKEPNDLAAKLSREKLYNLFPEVEKEVLAELLMAHDNNFQATVEVLLVSTGKANILSEQNGLNNFVTQKEMERQNKVLEEEKKALSEVEWPLLPTGEVPDMDVVNNYRDTADRHLRSRDLNIQKACDYVRRGMLTVGSYYRQLAEFHKLKYEQSNSLAAASLMQLHAAKCPDSATIDLHYLRVGEAKESLDLFLDTHIQKLKSLHGQGARHHTLYFITGRGLHSHGKPRVKPAIKKRLRERGLGCTEVNPGLLSAKVCADDSLTHQVA